MNPKDHQPKDSSAAPQGAQGPSVGLRLRMALLFGLCVVPLAGAVAALVYIEGERSTEFERNRLQALVLQYVERQDSLVESSSLYSQALVKDLHLAQPGADCTAALAAMVQQQPGRFLHLAVRGAAGELWCSTGAPPQPLGEQAQASLTAALRGCLHSTRILR